MAWIYGGRFYSGTSKLNLYDGRIMATAGDVIVVSMLYTGWVRSVSCSLIQQTHQVRVTILYTIALCAV